MSSIRRSSRASLVAVLLLASGAFVACGGDDSGGGAGPAAGASASGGAGGAKVTTPAPAIAFVHKEQALPGFTYDTGLQPAASPVQVGLKVSVAGEASIEAEAYALEGAVLKGRKGTGHVKIKGAFVLDGQVKGELAGFKYDGDIPGLTDQKFEFSADAPFEPFTIGKEIVAIAKVPPKKLPKIPLPGGLPGHILIELLEGSTVEIGFTGTCADHDGATAVYEGKVRRGGTVKFSTKLVLTVPLTPEQVVPLPDMTLPIAGIATPVDLGKPKAVVGTPPADAGETASPACRGPGAGGRSGAGGASGSSGASGAAGSTAGGGMSSGGAAGQGGASAGAAGVGGQSQGGSGGQGQAGTGQAGQAQGGNGQAGQGGNGEAGQGQAGNGEAGNGEAGQGQAGNGEAGQGQAGQGQAGQGQAGQGQAGQGQAGQGQGGTGQAGSGQAGQGQGGTGTGDVCTAISAKDFVVVSADVISGAISPNLAGGAVDALTIGQYGLPDGGAASFALGIGINANYGTCEQCVLVRRDDGKRFLATSGTLSITRQSPLAPAFSSGKLTNVRLREVTIDEATAQSTPVPNGGCFDLVETTWTVPTAACDDGGASYGSGSSACNACHTAESSSQGCCGPVSFACGDSPDCLSVASCLGNCNTQACSNACAQANPVGYSLYQGEFVCLYGDGAFVGGACGQACN